MAESGQPYPIKALIAFRMNPVKSSGQTAAWIKALQKLDLVVAIDTQMSETAMYAHYILPESHYLERMEAVSVVGDTVSLRQPALPRPLHDTRSGWEIIRGLAEVTGIGEYFGMTMEEVNDKLLAPSGWNTEQLKERGVLKVSATPFDYTRLATASGKVELANPGFEQSGSTRVVGWVPPRTRPDNVRLQLLHGHVPVHTNGHTQNIAPLYQLMPENHLWIHPQAAAERGIRTGDLVEVANEYGRERLKALVTQGIRPDCVWMCHGFGTMAPEQRLACGKGANDNALYPIMVTPVSGALGQGDATVTVRKAGG